MFFLKLVIYEIKSISLIYWGIALLIYVFVFVLCKKKIVKTKAIEVSILFTYTFLIIALTVLSRGLSTETYNFHPFWSYRQFFSGHGKYIMIQVILNVLLMIPFGALLSNALAIGKEIKIIKEDTSLLKTVMLTGVTLSVIIEILQFILHRGFCEIDDLIHNALGTIIGYLFWKLMWSKGTMQ